MSGKRPKDGRSGVFIDFSNLFKATGRKDPVTGANINYRICYIKLRDFLKKHHNSPVFYNVYACVDVLPKSEPYITRAINHGKFLDVLTGIGYNVIRKDLKYLPNTTKCDTDVEITMDLHKFMPDVDNIIIFTGDSDLLSALQHFHLNGKYIHVYSFEDGMSWELELFAHQNPRFNYTLLDEIKSEIERI